MSPAEDSVAVSGASHAAWGDIGMIAWQPATNGSGGTPATCPDSHSHATLLQIGSFPTRDCCKLEALGYPGTPHPTAYGAD
jgi:hypothetical protein